jgi:pimeloyl-ACP methyl ester carboxylesterase
MISAAAPAPRGIPRDKADVRPARRDTLSRVGKRIALVAVAAASGLYAYYRRWLGAQRRRASETSVVVATALGPVEYDLRGHGPTVLHFHGGNVGHNGWFFLEHLVAAGYRLLTPDRPGYLGTPLAGHGAPEAQADLAAALLDTLGIDRVAVVGLSAGGPAALQFVLRHQRRTRALILLSAISRRTPLSQDQLDSALGRLVMSRRGQDPAYFLINQAMKRMPKLAMQDYVRTETTYDKATGQRFIDRILADPAQRRQVMALADAMVPALPRFDGVSNDLAVQQQLDDLPLGRIAVPTLVVGSRHDGDIGYANSTHAAEAIPNAELITVDQFGHLIWWGDPAVTAAFQRRIEAFLDEHVARPSPPGGGAPE